MGLDVLRLAGAGLVVRTKAMLMGLDVVVVLRLFLLEAIVGHELLLLEGLRHDRRFQVLDGLLTQNLPCSASNTQACAILRRMRQILGQLAESSRAFRDVFRNPGLRRIELAWAASIIGTWAYGIAVVVYAYEQGGATAVGVVGLARWVAAAIASPFAAILGDRYDRRLVMVLSDLARAALIGVAALCVFADASPILVYIIAGLVGVAATAFRPAEAALIPSLARPPEELTAANVAASTIESVGIFGGPAIGGLLLAAAGPGVVFLVTGAAMLWSALLIAGIRPSAEPKGEREAVSVLDELLAGFRTIA